MAQDADVLEQALAWRNADQGVALATVIRTWGSAPRGTGSLMAVNETGDFVGSVSGGCVENAVIEEAKAAIDSGEPRIVEFGVTDEQAWEVGLACGGRISIYLEKIES